MDTTIEFHEVVNNISVSFEDTTDIVSIEVIEVEEVNTIVFDELGSPGISGKSAYQIALENGFVGSEEQWLESQKNVDGGLIY